MSSRRFLSLATSGVLVAAGIAPDATAQTPARDFVADYVFEGPTLEGWRPFGGGAWREENGQIIGSARGGSPGWLLSNHHYQDVAFWTNFRCNGPCDAGILFRAERTEQGMEGVFVSLSPEDHAPYRVRINGKGRIVSRERLGPGGGPRVADPPPASDPPVPQPAAPAQPSAIRDDGWNELGVTVDATFFRARLNGTARTTSGNTGDEGRGFGSVALYVGGGEVRFAEVAIGNLRNRSAAAETIHPHFRVQRLNPHHYAWDAAVADFNRDGIQDIVAGPWIYLGPDFTQMREIYLAQTFNPGRTYAPNMVTHAFDFTGDGWPDVLATEGRRMVLYENPAGLDRRWDRHLVLPGVTAELTLMHDIDGDGIPEIVHGAGNHMVYAKVDPVNPTEPWTIYRFSEAAEGNVNAHGVGVGDVNGDGRPDILHADGWWEQPATLSGVEQKWTYHPVDFRTAGHIRGGGGAAMAVFDVNGDGWQDVVTSLNAHGWGLAWYEQQREGERISFRPHLIMGDFSTEDTNAGGLTFSQLHSGAIPADLDNDGIMDFVTGVRYWSHLDGPGDPDAYGPPYTVWYRTVRDPLAPGGARFEPEVLHNQSGVGSLFKIVDLDGDGGLDIVSSGTWGTTVLWNEMP